MASDMIHDEVGRLVGHQRHGVEAVHVEGLQPTHSTGDRTDLYAICFRLVCVCVCVCVCV